MVKVLNIAMDDTAYNWLLQKKGKHTWKEYLLKGWKKEEDEK